MALVLLNLILGSIIGILLKCTYNIWILIIFFLLFIVLGYFTKKKVIFYIVSALLFYLVCSNNVPEFPKDFNDIVLIISKKNGYYIALYKRYKFIIYSDESFNLLARIHINGTLKILNHGASINVKSFNDYLYNSKVYYSLNINNYEIINKGDFIKERIKSFLLYGLSENSENYVKLLVLGDKSGEIDLYNKLVSLGVVHLIVISGLHLNILYDLFSKVFKKIDNKIVIVILFFYVYLLDFSIPVLRAFLYLLFKEIFKNKNVSNFTGLFGICFLFVLINPRIIYSISFQLTFITNTVILFLTNLDNNFFIKYILRPILIYLSTIPIVIYMNNQISLLAVIYTIILMPLIPYIYIFSIITSLIKIIDPAFSIICNLFNKISDIMVNNNLSIIIVNLKMYLIILYFSIFIILLYCLLYRNKKKSFLCFVLIFSIILISNKWQYLFGTSKVIFIDVGQGDSTLIIGPHNKYNILIDTGGLKDYDVASKRIIPLLKSQGISKLDGVIITHDDYDHNGALESLINNYNVDKVYFGPDEYTININDFKIENLNHFYTSISEDNEQSSVLYFENGNYNYLVMGDAPSSIEKKIIENYDVDVDVLRIGHHGSKTSTSIEFLKAINPKYAVISVGYNNYGHPSNIVLNYLKQCNIEYYRTDINHNICFNNAIIKNY